MESVQGWLEELSYFLVLGAVALHLLPEASYRKYVRFYLGLILIALMLEPIGRLQEIKFPDFTGETESIEQSIEALEEEYETEFGF